MKAFTLIAMLVAGTAFAQPREERGGRVLYHAAEASQPSVRDGWVLLSTPTPTKHGTEWISIDRTVGPMRTLKLVATSGSVHVQRVQVVFSSERTVTYNLDKHLSPRRPSTNIDFGGRFTIAQVVVTTARRPVGTYTVQGSLGTAPTGVLVSMR
ncbi:hypothetical protein BH11MYX3_BH11MYX3_16450 [soil metagenome]